MGKLAEVDYGCVASRVGANFYRNACWIRICEVRVPIQKNVVCVDDDSIFGSAASDDDSAIFDYAELRIVRQHLEFDCSGGVRTRANAPLFILIFYQFFIAIPASLEEAAEIDGARITTVFFKIAVPMAVPSIIVSLIFSMVWYWNETTLTALFLQTPGLDSNFIFTTLPLELQNFTSSFEMIFPDGAFTVTRVNEGVRMAGMIISILPMLVVYFILQRWFVEGVDRSGITGE